MTNHKQTTFGYIELLSAAKNIYHVLGSSTSAMKVANCCLSTVGWLYHNCQANANGGSVHGCSGYNNIRLWALHSECSHRLCIGLRIVDGEMSGSCTISVLLQAPGSRLQACLGSDAGCSGDAELRCWMQSNDRCHTIRDQTTKHFHQ